MRKLLLFVGYFTITPCVLLASILLLAWTSYTKQGTPIFSFASQHNPAVTYTALPSETGQITTTVSEADARVTKLAAFFHEYHSLLEEYSQDIVTAADAYNLDYRLLPAIAMQESKGCAKIIADSHNCWGWGIYTKHITKFDNYDDAITTISKLLAKNYSQKGMDTPEEIGKMYNPRNTNDWVGKVNYFMGEIENEPIIAYLTNL